MAVLVNVQYDLSLVLTQKTFCTNFSDVKNGLLMQVWFLPRSKDDDFNSDFRGLWSEQFTSCSVPVWQMEYICSFTSVAWHNESWLDQFLKYATGSLWIDMPKENNRIHLVKVTPGWYINMLKQM